MFLPNHRTKNNFPVIVFDLFARVVSLASQKTSRRVDVVHLPVYGLAPHAIPICSSANVRLRKSRSYSPHVLGTSPTITLEQTQIARMHDSISLSRNETQMLSMATQLQEKLLRRILKQDAFGELVVQ